MRIIKGILKNKSLTQTNKNIYFRPMTERMRKIIFDTIGEIKDFCILDLCSGSGVIGMECISRGAKFCVMIEKNRFLCSQINKNLKIFKIEKFCNVIKADMLKWIENNDLSIFDIIFLDPPYQSDIILQTLDLIKIKKNQLLIIHHEKKLILKDKINNLNKIKSKKIGQSFVDFYY